MLKQHYQIQYYINKPVIYNSVVHRALNIPMTQHNYKKKEINITMQISVAYSYTIKLADHVVNKKEYKVTKEILSYLQDKHKL